MTAMRGRRRPQHPTSHGRCPLPTERKPHDVHVASPDRHAIGRRVCSRDVHTSEDSTAQHGFPACLQLQTSGRPAYGDSRAVHQSRVELQGAGRVLPNDATQPNPRHTCSSSAKLWISTTIEPRFYTYAKADQRPDIVFHLPRAVATDVSVVHPSGEEGKATRPESEGENRDTRSSGEGTQSRFYPVCDGHIWCAGQVLQRIDKVVEEVRSHSS
jgi:hypothetical protein